MRSKKDRDEEEKFSDRKREWEKPAEPSRAGVPESCALLWWSQHGKEVGTVSAGNNRFLPVWSWTVSQSEPQFPHL